MNFNARQKILMELCVRSVLCSLLDREESTVQDFTAGLHNLNVGAFGDKGYSFQDTNDWISCLQDLRDIIAMIDPIYHQAEIDAGSQPYRLEEEGDLVRESKEIAQSLRA